MQRVVIDPGVIISGLLSPAGPPGQILAAVRAGELEAVVSEHLLNELADVLTRPKFRGFITIEEAIALDDELRRVAHVAADPPDPESLARDPDDDYLIALAKTAEADAIISGDGDPLALVTDPPVIAPRAFLERLQGDASS